MPNLRLNKESTRCPKCDAVVFSATAPGQSYTVDMEILLNPPAPVLVQNGRDGRDLRMASTLERHVCRRQYPNRTYKVTVIAQGDTWKDAIRELQHCAQHLEEHGPECKQVSGGYSTSSTIEVLHDPEMTGDKYREIIEALKEDILKERSVKDG